MLEERYLSAKVWASKHFDVGFDLIRLYLGLGLMVRGAVVLAHPELVSGYLDGFNWIWPTILLHYIVAVHVIGGFLLAIGLVTRLAAVAQLPALIGALFIVHVREKLFSTNQALELSALVLFMLIVIAFFGAGRLSVDHYIFGDANFLYDVHLGRRART